MHKELEKLLNIALKDNVLNEKEREILFRKAKQLNVDLDEFEMELEGVLSELGTQNEKLGEQSSETKCPNCGSQISSYAIKCEFCGYEVREKEANANIVKLFEMLNAIEDTRKEDSDNPFAAMGSAFAKSFANSFGGDKITRKKIEIISSFPIPNTKEDILEFLSHAIPKARQKGNLFTKNSEANYSHNQLVPTWKAKCEQIIIKARFSFNEDKSSLKLIEEYAKQLNLK